jgi:hypothetical protein
VPLYPRPLNFGYAQKPNLGGVEARIGADLTHPHLCRGGGVGVWCGHVRRFWVKIVYCFGVSSMLLFDLFRLQCGWVPPRGDLFPSSGNMWSAWMGSPGVNCFPHR